MPARFGSNLWAVPLLLVVTLAMQPASKQPMSQDDKRELLRFMYQTTAKGNGKSFQDWLAAWRQCMSLSSRVSANSLEGHSDSSRFSSRFWTVVVFSKVWCNNFAFVSATICITLASQGHFQRHETTGDWRWVDPAWSSEWQPASSEAHDVGGPGRGKGSGTKSVDGSAAVARAAMTLEEATEWAAELFATSSQTAKSASPVVANDGMPRFVEVPKAGLGFKHVAPSPTAKGVPLPSPAEAPAEWQGPISPFSPKKREPEKCREAAKSKKEKKLMTNDQHRDVKKKSWHLVKLAVIFSERFAFTISRYFVLVPSILVILVSHLRCYWADGSFSLFHWCCEGLDTLQYSCFHRFGRIRDGCHGQGNPRSFGAVAQSLG